MSTSSSEHGRGLRALGCAAVALLALDVLAFRACSPWERIAAAAGPKLETLRWGDRGTVHHRVALRELDALPEASTVFVMGTSRARDAFDPVLAGAVNTDLRFVSMAHARTFGPELREQARTLARRAPAAVVLGISELDTHAPLDFRSEASYRSTRGFLELAELAGVGFALESRVRLYRTWVGDALQLYRYRGILGALGVDSLRRFRRARPPRSEVSFDAPTASVADALAERFAARVPDERAGRRDRVRRDVRRQLWVAGHASRGPDVSVQMALIERTVGELRGSGARVLIAEPPVLPEVRRLQDPETREEFLRFAEGLARDPEVRLLRLEDQPVYVFDDFVDSHHLGPSGSAKFTPAVLDRLSP